MEQKHETIARLAQLAKRWSVEWEAAGSNPSQTTEQLGSLLRFS